MAAESLSRCSQSPVLAFKLLSSSVVKSGANEGNVFLNVSAAVGILFLLTLIVFLLTLILFLLPLRGFFCARCECLNNPNIPPSQPENPPTGWLIAPNRRANTEFIFHVLFNPVA